VWVAIHHDSAYLAQPLVVLVLVAPTAAAAIATASPSGGKSSFLSIFIFCRSLYILIKRDRTFEGHSAMASEHDPIEGHACIIFKTRDASEYHVGLL
jgi:hypothetical protein